MRLLPVLDLLNCVVVRGVAGQRESYRPVQSRIVDSADPLAVARAFRDHFGLHELYVADLDAILSARPNLKVYEQLANEGFKLLVDAGVRNPQAARAILQAGADSVIAGLESTPSPAWLQELVTQCGSEKILFSLDLKQGQPLSDSPGWTGKSPLQIAEAAFECGIRRLIVLDLAQVGVGAGISTLTLCDQIRELAARRKLPNVELITGGGVRDVRDLELMLDAGIDGVLVASALHNGRLKRSELEAIMQGERHSTAGHE